MEPPTPASADWDTANIHLQLWEEEHVFAVPIPLGPRALVDLLHGARALSSQTTNATVARAQKEGRAISCRAGCGACCRQLVAISVVEARGLADLVARLPPERQAVIRERFAGA